MGHRLNPWSGKVLRATGQLSLRTTSTEAHMPYRAHVPQQERSAQREAHKPQQRAAPPATTGESPCTAEDPVPPKIIIVREIFK